MRRFPCSWNDTLTALGFKRKKRKASPKRSQRLEQLEARVVLSADPLIPFTVDSEFVIVGGTGRQYFDLERSESGGVVLQMRDGAAPPVDEKLTLQVEKRLGRFAQERFEVVVDLVEQDFLEEFYAQRIEQSALTTESIDVVTTPIGPQEFGLGRASRKAPGSDLGLTVDRQTPTRPRGFEQLLIDANGAKGLTGEATKRLYEELSASNSVHPSDGRIDLNRASFGDAALLLSKQLRDDLRGNNASLAAEAKKLRDRFVEETHSYYTLWTGLGVNHVIEKTERGSGEYQFVLYETGDYAISSELSINLGREASIEAQRHGGFGVSLPPLLAALVADLPATQDTTITSLDTSSTWAETYELAYAGFYGGQEYQALFGFDISQVAGGHVNDASATIFSDVRFGATSLNQVNSATGSFLDWSGTPLWADQGALGFGPVISSWTPASDSFQSVDLTEVVQRATRFGDLNLDGAFDATDLDALHSSILYPANYADQYGLLASYDYETVYSGDANWDNLVDHSDVGAIFDRLGQIRGDYNLDGVSDRSDWDVWVANFGRSDGTYSDGDGNFDGIVNSADYTVWRDGFGGVATTPSDPLATLRVQETNVSGANAFVGYATNEHGDATKRPALSVTQTPDLVAKRFDGSGDEFRVVYNIVNDTFASGAIEVWRSSDGVTLDSLVFSQPLVGSELTVGHHNVELASDLVGDAEGDYQLVARVVGTSTSGEAEHSIANNVVAYTGEIFSDVAFSQGSIAVVESSGAASLSVSRPSGDGTTTVQYAVTPVSGDSGDLTSLSGVITFSDGETSKPINLPIIDDTLAEGIESFRVEITSIAGIEVASGASATLSVLDDEHPWLKPFVVNSLNDAHDANPGDGLPDSGLSPHHSDVTLRAALEEVASLAGILASAGVTSGTPQIEFDASLGSGQSILLDPTLGGLSIQTSVDLIGPGAFELIIDANGSVNQEARVLAVQSGVTAQVSGLTLTGGYTTTMAGAGVFNQGDLTLDGVRVTNNTAAENLIGGGIYSFPGGSLALRDSEVSYNRAGQGAGLRLLPTASAGTSDSYTIENSTIAHNTAETVSLAAAVGGGIFIGRNLPASVNGDISSSLTITNSTLSHNYALSSYDASGAVVKVGAYGALDALNVANVVIEGSTIVGNESSVGTGGVLVRYDERAASPVAVPQVAVRGTLFANNRGNGLTADYNSWTVDASHAAPQYSYSGNIATKAIAGSSPSEFLEVAYGDLKLSDLGSNGGRTPTHALAPGSVAIDPAFTWTAAAADQRDVPRDASPDIGAFEYVAAASVEGDFDGDGYSDRLEFDGTNALYVDSGRSSQGPNLWASITNGQFNTWRVGDFNGDGRDDVAFRNNSNVWSVAFSETTRFNVISSGHAPDWFSAEILVGDFDGDGADELIGRKDSVRNDGLPDTVDNTRWRILSWAADNSAKPVVVAGTSHPNEFNSFRGKMFVADVNRDGRDDLIGSIDPALANATSPSQNNSLAPAWHVSASRVDPGTGDITFDSPSGAFTDWGDWLDGYYDAASGTIDADAAYASIVKNYLDIYNNVETQFYGGLLKGHEATWETGRGNPWDQSALLVDRLRADGIEAEIVTGKITVPLDVLAAWTGTVEGIAAAVVIQQSLDPANINPAADSHTFNHAWVRAKAPTTNGLDWVDLDPSWKFKNRQEGIQVQLSGPNGAFDELAYLAEADGRLPIEYFEDKVSEYLATNNLNASLSEVAYDGPIIQQRDYGEALSNPARLTSATGRTIQGSAADVFANATSSDSHTHRARITVGSWVKDLILAETALDQHTIFLSGQTLTYTINGTIQETVTLSSSNATLELRQAKPGQSLSSRPPFSFSIDGNGNGNRYAIALDVDQFSVEELTDRRSALNAAVADGVTVSDIDPLMHYVNALYWHDQQRFNRQSSALLHHVAIIPHAQLGLVQADNSLLTGNFEHLQFPIVPRDLAVDLPGGAAGLVDIRFDNSAVALRDPEVFQLSGYTASALESAVIEEVINSDSVSTIDGLLSAHQGDPGISSAPVNSVWVVQSVDEGGRKVYVRGELGNRATEGSNNLPYSPTRTNHLVSSKEALRNNYFPSHPAAAINNIWSLLTSDVSGTATAILPEHLSYAGDDSANWEGSVYVLEKVRGNGSDLRGRYAIQAVGGPTMNGGRASNSTTAPNPSTAPPATPGGSNFAGDPVNVLNGNMFRDEVDVEMPNIGVPLSLSRHYDAQSEHNVGFGVGWVHSFGDRLIRRDEAPGEIVWLTSEGVRHTFVPEGPGWKTPAELFGSLSTTPSGYVFKDDRGIEHHFETVTALAAVPGEEYFGRLSKIVDRDGNGVQASYLSSNSFQIDRAEDVHDPTRRLKFVWSSGQIISVDKVVDGVTVADWDYAYATPTGDRLTSVTNPLNDATVFEYHPSGLGEGMISRIIETDDSYHDYEYYANGRAFRVTEGIIVNETPVPQSSHSFNYNLFRDTTEFVDENQHVQTYVHQEDGRLVRHVFNDRSRLLTSWGVIGSGGIVEDTQFLMRSRTNETGAVETFTYYVNEAAANTFKNRKLKTSSQDRGFGGSDLVTAYDYSKATAVGSEHIVNLASVTVDSTGDPRTTNYGYDDRGRLTEETNPEGNQTRHSYYLDVPTNDPRYGLRKETVSPRGNTDGNVEGNEAVVWQILADNFTVNSGVLSVSLEKINGDRVIADAIRVEQLNDRGAVETVYVIDNTGRNEGLNAAETDPFRLVPAVGSASPGFWEPSLDHPDYPEYLNDNIGLSVNGSRAAWRFDRLAPGKQYRVSATWDGHPSNDLATYRLHDGGIDTVAGAVVSNVPQGVAPQGFSAFATNFDYNDAGQVIRTEVAGAPYSEQTYHHTGRTGLVTDPTGRATETTYDALGRPLSSAQLGELGDPDDDLVTSFVNDERGRLERSTDALGRVTEYEYDRRGSVTKQTHADGAVWTYTYDTVGNRLSATDPLGRTTEYAYDGKNRLVQTWLADGATQLLRYDGADRVTVSIDPLGRESHSRYDEQGRLISNTAAFGADDAATTQQKYNRRGELIETVDANGIATQFFYDDLSRVVKTMVLHRNRTDNGLHARSSSGGNTPVYVETMAYDANGNVVETIVYDTLRAPGNIHTTDLLNPNLRELLETGVVTTVSGVPLSASAYQTTTIAYDNLNRPTVTTHADGTTTSVEYDAAGRVRFAEDERGARAESRYDAYGRLVTTLLPDPDTGLPDGPNSPITTFVYDPVGNIIETLDPNGHKTVSGYDERNRLVTTTNAVGSTSRSVYDIAGQMIATIDANEIAVATRYDERGRPVQVSWVDPDGPDPLTAPLETFEYDAVGNQIASTDARGYRTTYGYDDLNRLESERVPRAHVVSGALERLGTVDPVTGHSDQDAETIYQYDAVGNLTSLTDANGGVTEYAYDEVNRRTSETLPDPDAGGPIKRLTLRSFYDGYGNTWRTDEYEAGSDTVYRFDSFEFDQRNRLVAENYNLGAPAAANDRVRNESQYDAAGNLVAYITAAATAGIGSTTRYDYDFLGRQVVERIDAPLASDAGRRSTQSEYDSAGNLVSETYTVRDGVVASATDRSTTTSYTYDAINRLTAVTEDVGGIEATSRTGYDPVGNVVLAVDATGIATRHEYDDLYRVVRTTRSDPTPHDGAPSTLVESFAYDAAGNLVSSINGENEQQTYLHNTFGQVVESRTVMPSADIVATSEYDKLGNRVGFVDPTGNQTTFVYDKLNRVTKEIQGVSENAANTRTYVFNDEGDLEWVTDRNGRVTIYDYDGLDRLVSERWFADVSAVTSGELENILVWEHDQLGRVVAQGNHYVASRRPSVIYAGRYVESFEYDTLDRLTKQRNYLPLGVATFSGAGVALANFRFNPLLDQEYHHDQLTGLQSGELNAYEYVQTFEPTLTGFGALDFDREYARTTIATDALGRVRRASESENSSLPGSEQRLGKEILFDHDNAGRMTGVTRNVDTDNDGDLSNFYFATDYAYDPSGRIAEIAHSRYEPGRTFASHRYGYDDASRISSIDATTHADALRLDRSETFVYDDSGRLTNWDFTLTDQNVNHALPTGGTVDLTVVPGQYDIDHTLDGSGNRTGAEYQTDDFNRVSRDGDYQYDFDAEGNTTARWNANRTELLTRYVWDHRNRLVRVEHAPGTASAWNVEYGYNNDDLRVRKVVYAGDPSTTDSDTLTITEAETYAWDGGQLSAVIDGAWGGTGAGAAGPQAIYSNGAYQRRVQGTPGAVDQALFEEVFRDTAGGDSVGLFWAATDHAGSVRDVLASDHTLATHLEYNAHGEHLLALDGQKQNVNDLGEAAIDAAFAGREWDAETGLYYNRARWYDAGQGRFISEDPIGLAAGDPNVYRYTGGDPVNFTDPSGLQAAGDPFAGVTTAPSSTPSPGSATHFIERTDLHLMGPIPRCISCHNPIIMNGGSVTDLPPRFFMGAAMALGTDDPVVMDAMISGMRQTAQNTRAGVSAVGQVGLAMVPGVGPLTLLGGSILLGAGSASIEYAASGDSGVAIDRIPLAGLRHAPQQVNTVFDSNATLSERVGAGFNLTVNTLEALPVVKSLARGVKNAHAQGLQSGLVNGPSVSRGASLDNLTPSQQRQIQEFANREGVSVTVTGSRASGTSKSTGKPFTQDSDFDFVLGEGANAKTRKHARRHLPKGRAGGEVRGTRESGQDFFKRVEEGAESITFFPESS